MIQQRDTHSLLWVVERHLSMLNDLKVNEREWEKGDLKQMAMTVCPCNDETKKIKKLLKKANTIRKIKLTKL